MKQIKKIFVLATAIILTLCMSGCRLLFPEQPYLPEYEDDYFRYAVKTFDDGSQECYIIGFTELGAEQTELIMPSNYNGIPVVDFGYKYKRTKITYVDEYIGYLYSEKLQKLYLPVEVDEALWKGEFGVSCNNVYTVHWKTAVIKCDVGKGLIIGKNILANKLPYQNNFNRVANVSYMYNYAGAEDDGYYWVDSYDKEIITFIPPEPTREGYRFGGWYKEEECINKWDFEHDKTGRELIIESYSTFEDFNDSQITFLFAKWENL